MGTVVELTAEQRSLARAYLRAGYTAVFFDAEDGCVLPGYADWSLSYVLDELELRDRCSDWVLGETRDAASATSMPGPTGM